MNYRRLGRSGLKVSEVALGGWLTHGRTLEDGATTNIVRRAFELGINFFDTADVYHRGEAEKALAKAIQGIRRSDLVIATKCFFPMSDGPNDRGLSRKHITESCHASLRRLMVDYVDLYQFHRFDEETPVEETVMAVNDLIRQGKVLYWGVSEWPAEQIARAVHLSRELGCCPPISNQPQYNIFQRKIEASVLPISEQLGLGQVVFSPLAQGVLTGKYKPGEAPKEGTRAADEDSNKFMESVMTEDRLLQAQELKGLAERHGITPGQLALAWCLRLPGISSVIVGATKVDHIEDNAKASDVELGSEVWEEVDSIIGE